MSSSSILPRPVVTPSAVRFMSSSFRCPCRARLPARPTLGRSPGKGSIFHTDPCHRIYCSVCDLADCPIRREPYRATDRTVREIAHGAVDAVAGIGMEDHLALRSQVPHGARRHLLGEIVGALHAPELRHHQMRFDVLEAAGSYGSQMMHTDDAVTEVPLERGEHAVQERWIFLVEEAPGRVPHQLETRPHEPERDEERDHGIEPSQPGKADETEADHDACARPYIGEYVLTVGDQGERAVSTTGADQVASEGEVDERGAEHDENAQTDLAHLGSLDEAAEGAVDDEDGS